MIINFNKSLSLVILLFTLLYSSLYILRDIYTSTENFQMKKSINKLLPFFTKYNKAFLIFTFIILIFSYYNLMFSSLLFFITAAIILLSLFCLYSPISKIKSTSVLRILSYILLVEVLIIPLS